MQLFGIIGDIHLPYTDFRALELALDLFADIGITDLILNGDVADFYCVNAYGPKHVEVQQTIETEIDSVNEFLDKVQKKLPKAKITFIYGNHEFRLERFIMDKCPIFWNFLKLENHLRLEERGIDWVPYNERLQLGNSSLFVQHSPPSYSQNAAGTSLKKKIDEDHIWNCSHRTDMYCMTGSSGKVYTSYINGWFGSTGIMKKLQKEMPENRRVFAYTKNHESWNTSLCVAAVHKENHHVTQVLFKDYTAMFGGVIYEG